MAIVMILQEMNLPMVVYGGTQTAGGALSSGANTFGTPPTKRFIWKRWKWWSR